MVYEKMSAFDSLYRTWPDSLVQYQPTGPTERRHLAVHHFTRVTKSSSATPTHHKNRITISTTSSKYKVLAADIRGLSLLDSPHAEQEARISHLNAQFTSII